MHSFIRKEKFTRNNWVKYEMECFIVSINLQEKYKLTQSSQVKVCMYSVQQVLTSVAWNEDADKNIYVLLSSDNILRFSATHSKDMKANSFHL